MENTKIPCEREDCCGCGVCSNVCAFGAITMTSDERGFYVPKVDMALCRSCGRCSRVCPGVNARDVEDYQKKVYAVWTRDDEIRKVSTSGGLFSELASSILEQGGEVWGVAFDEKFTPRHICVREKEELRRLRGSKYLQSDASGAYPLVKKALAEGKKVFFTGTPCQCSGLRNFLGREYDNLVTMDFVCHGTPSLGLFQSYLDSYVQPKYQSEITEVRFRVKLRGWSGSGNEIKFANGDVYRADFFHDPYLIAFTRNYSLNNSCYHCRYANLNRPADITVSDYWGYISRKFRYRNTNRGVSMAMINTAKGEKFFHDVLSKCVYVGTSLQEGVEGNPCLSHSFRPAKKRDEFWNAWLAAGKDFGAVAPQFFPERKKSLKGKISVWINSHMWLLPGVGQKLFYAVKRRVKRGG